MTTPITLGLTASLGAFAANHREFPDAALQTARDGIVDVVGVLLAGRTDPAVRALAAVLAPSPNRRADEVSLFFGAAGARPLDAVFLNAAAAHVLAMDDVASGCHPSALLFPALLATGESLGSSGLQLLQAYVVGFEVLAELASRESDALHSAGWHPSCMLGPPAVAAAVARLHGLSADRCTAAIAVAASMTGGLVANFGTQTKAIQVARASSAGILAAQLAAHGLTASTDALERDPGLLKAISPQRNARRDGEFAPGASGLRILDHGLSFKKYPVCYSTHRVVDAAARIAEMPGFEPAEVESVSVEIGKTQAWMADHHQVRTAFEAKYSVEFAAAAGLVARDASFDQLGDGFIFDPVVQRLIGSTTLRLLDEKSSEDPVFSPADRVVVRTSHGVFDSGPVPYASGHARLPLPTAARFDKFAKCAASTGFENVRALYELLDGLQGVADVRQLRPGGAGALSGS